MSMRRFLFLLLLLFCAACATQPSQGPAALDVLRESGGVSMDQIEAIRGAQMEQLLEDLLEFIVRVEAFEQGVAQ